MWMSEIGMRKASGDTTVDATVDKLGPDAKKNRWTIHRNFYLKVLYISETMLLFYFFCVTKVVFWLPNK
jgi:hypothetical protein